MAFDTYLVFEGGIKGESTAVKDAVEIFSFSWGASSPVHHGGAGHTASKVSISSFNVMKKTDSSSAQLFLNCCKGTHIPKVTAHMRKQTGDGGQQDFLVYEFSEVLVESIQWSGSSGGDDTPTESVSFAFAKVHVTYKKQDQKGALSVAGDVTWDIQHMSTK